MKARSESLTLTLEGVSQEELPLPVSVSPASNSLSATISGIECNHKKSINWQNSTIYSLVKEKKRQKQIARHTQWNQFSSSFRSFQLH